MSKPGLTEDERALTAKLGECMVAYGALPHWDLTRTDDCNEFASTIHILQRQVMCRAAQRAHPEQYARGEWIG